MPLTSGMSIPAALKGRDPDPVEALGDFIKTFSFVESMGSGFIISLSRWEIFIIVYRG